MYFLLHPFAATILFFSSFRPSKRSFHLPISASYCFLYPTTISCYHSLVLPHGFFLYTFPFRPAHQSYLCGYKSGEWRPGPEPFASFWCSALTTAPRERSPARRPYLGVSVICRGRLKTITSTADANL